MITTNDVTISSKNTRPIPLLSPFPKVDDIHMRDSAPNAPFSFPRVLDHAHLTTLRSFLTPKNSRTSTTEESACAAAAALSPLEVARELRRYPPGSTRVNFVAILGAYGPAESFRRHVLQNPLLLSPPTQLRRDTVAAEHRQALHGLVQRWRPLVERDEQLKRVLDGLLDEEEETVERREEEDLRGGLIELQETVAELERRLVEIVTLCEGNAAGHDGLDEMVSATWAQIRKRRADLAELRGGLVATAESSENQRDRLETSEMVQQVDTLVRSLHERRRELMRVGFHVGSVSPQRIESDSDSEDEWEEAVHIGGEEIEGNVDANQGSNRTDVEVQLPEVQDWTKVMRGEEGREVNRMILEQFEQRGGTHVAVTAQALDDTNRVQQTGNDVTGGRKGKRIKGKKQAPTAKQRLSAALGIKKKRKKKGLLDDD